MEAHFSGRDAVKSPAFRSVMAVTKIAIAQLGPSAIRSTSLTS
jgi:hypothetical protein